jgi:hypothetical protein
VRRVCGDYVEEVVPTDYADSDEPADVGQEGVPVGGAVALGMVEDRKLVTTGVGCGSNRAQVCEDGEFAREFPPQ